MNIEPCSKNTVWKWMSDIYFDTGNSYRVDLVLYSLSLPPVKTGGYLQATPTELFDLHPLLPLLSISYVFLIKQ